MPLNFCANLSFMFTECDNLLERYKLAETAGFKNVECAFPYDHSIEAVVEAKKNANVNHILLNVYPGDCLGFAALPGRQEEFKESLDKAIQYAKALECNKIHIMSGKTLFGIVDVAMHDVYKDNLQYAATVLEEHQIIGLIEPICHFALPNYYMNSFAKALQLIQDINSNFLKLQLDIFHLQMLEGNLSNRIKELLPFTGHIQISQAPNRFEPSAEGEINYQYILRLLEELNYEGFIGLEYKPKTSSTDSLTWITNWGYHL